MRGPGCAAKDRTVDATGREHEQKSPAVSTAWSGLDRAAGPVGARTVKHGRAGVRCG